MASILLCGILSDTLVLQSSTTTEIDRDAADYLSSITGLEIDALGRDLMGAASRVSALSAEELIRMDMKEYDELGASFTVSQVETEAPEVLVDRREEILAELASVRRSGKRLFSALMVTDVTELTSLLFVEGDKALLSLLTFPKSEEGIYLLKDIVSRKKQLMPLLAELIERALGK
jgi:manganese-dependent inorganic pyrophosphatase